MESVWPYHGIRVPPQSDVKGMRIADATRDWLSIAQHPPPPFATRLETTLILASGRRIGPGPTLFGDRLQLLHARPQLDDLRFGSLARLPLRPLALDRSVAIALGVDAALDFRLHCLHSLPQLRD
jgi:hypothetical protein